MSYSAMAWDELGHSFECRVCGSTQPLDPTLPYHKKGVCGPCVRGLASDYIIKHTGAPDERFCTADEWKEYLQSRRQGTERRPPKYWKERRLQVAARDGFVCHYCKKDVGVKRFTVDHIVPHSRGGTDDLSNLVGCCKSCNSSKHVRDYAEFVRSAK